MKLEDIQSNIKRALELENLIKQLTTQAEGLAEGKLKPAKALIQIKNPGKLEKKDIFDHDGFLTREAQGIEIKPEHVTAPVFFFHGSNEEVSKEINQWKANAGDTTKDRIIEFAILPTDVETIQIIGIFVERFTRQRKEIIQKLINAGIKIS